MSRNWWWFLFSSFFLLIAITTEEVIFNLRLNKIQFLWGFPGITRSPLNEHWFPTFLFWANHLIAPCCIVIAVSNTYSIPKAKKPKWKAIKLHELFKTQVLGKCLSITFDSSIYRNVCPWCFSKYCKRKRAVHDTDHQ